MTNTISRIWRPTGKGGTLVITIPAEIVRIYDFKEGQIVEMSWDEVRIVERKKRLPELKKEEKVRENGK